MTLYIPAAPTDFIKDSTDDINIPTCLVMVGEYTTVLKYKINIFPIDSGSFNGL